MGFNIRMEDGSLRYSPNAKLCLVNGLPPGTCFSMKNACGNFCIYDVKSGTKVSSFHMKLKEAIAEAEFRVGEIGIDKYMECQKSFAPQEEKGQLNLF